MKLPLKYEEMGTSLKALSNIGYIAAFLNRYGIGGKKIKSFSMKIEELHRTYEDLSSIISEFNEVFTPLGWVMSESTSLESAKKALELAKSGKLDEGESILVADYEGDKLDAFVKRLIYKKSFKDREAMINEALKLCHEERYMAAVPLLLMIVDGVGQDCFGKTIFSDRVDLIEANSIAGHEAGLLKLTRKMSSARRKLNKEEIRFPYRNGIMHGRDINFGNRYVVAKIWAYISTVADVIQERESKAEMPVEQKAGFWQVMKGYKKTKQYSKEVEKWKARPEIKSNWALLDQKFDFPLDAPEATLSSFLLSWKNKDYGSMGQLTLYFDNRVINKRAGQIRKILENILLQNAEITIIKDVSAAVTEIDCSLMIEKGMEKLTIPHTFRLIYSDEVGNPLLRGVAEGSWKLIPSYQGLRI